MSLFDKVGVVGAGMMGSEIALMFALAGHPTILSDEQRAQADTALDRLHGLIERGIVRGFWNAEQAQAARHNLSAVDGLEDFADRELVIEAVFENAELKRTIFARLDSVLPPNAGLASNTSSISIASLSAALAPERRRRFLGTHFFSPVSRMKLVEVIPTMDTDPAFFDQVTQALASIGKAPIRVKDVVGFAVNRLLHALVIEVDPAARRGGRVLALGYRHGLQTWTRPSDSGRSELPDNTANSLVAERPRGNPPCSLRRRFLAPKCRCADGRRRLQWTEGRPRLVSDTTRTASGREQQKRTRGAT